MMPRNLRTSDIIILAAAALAAFIPLDAKAAILTLNPSSGAFVVGGTFNVSILLNTEAESINAVEVLLKFPPDKLQVTSPSAGQSIIGVWASPPSYNNQIGEIRLAGGIPGGFNANNAVISTVSFRVKQTGRATIRFQDSSRVLLNDGLGTDALKSTTGAVYEFVLPPPAGPIVASETHPDSAKWYPIPNAVFKWEAEAGGIQGYSYVLDDQPITISDDISEGMKNGIAYRGLADGPHYFHIKAMRQGAWGGTTHFAINIDATPPAKFPIEIIPSARTTRRQPIIQFSTTDKHSGVDRYEIKIIPLTHVQAAEQPFFIEIQSPYIPSELSPGTYDTIMRAYDKAGNYREITKRLRIVTAIFRFIGEKGLEIRSFVILPWLWFWILTAVIVAGLGYLAFYIKRRHSLIHLQRSSKELPEHLKEQLDELKKYRDRYGKFMTMLLLAGTILFGGFSASAQELEVGPPIITSASKDISNTEIFYVGGKTESSNTQVILYMQNLQTGGTQRFEVISDKRNDWFYRHDTFMPTGNYLIWAQSKIGELLSPPSPQIQIGVRSTALQIGASRVSFELLNLILLILTLLVAFGLALYIGFHTYHARIKHRHLVKEIKEAEESIRRGFAVLRRDIEAELAVVKKARFSRELAEEEKSKEKQLLEDLEKVERYIGKEVWEVEEAERELQE